MFKHFELLPFIAGIIIGIIGFYFVEPDKTIVYKYPNPDNVGKYIYKDLNGTCYKYQTTPVDCNGKDVVKTYPLS